MSLTEEQKQSKDAARVRGVIGKDSFFVARALNLAYEGRMDSAVSLKRALVSLRDKQRHLDQAAIAHLIGCGYVRLTDGGKEKSICTLTRKGRGEISRLSSGLSVAPPFSPVAGHRRPVPALLMAFENK
jgi:hypothetical protein